MEGPPRQALTATAAALVAVLLAVLAAGCLGEADDGAPAPPADRPRPEADPAVRLEPFAAGFTKPVQVAFAPGDERAYVVEQTGRVRIVEGGRTLPDAFLDLSSRVTGGPEQGLLSIAFSPAFADDAAVYVHYTDEAGDTVVSRMAVADDHADPATERVVLAVDQPYTNHNGGLVTFGPDGMLYVGLGDGGSAGDPAGRAQDLGDLLGKILRLDPAGEPYGVPDDNPFAGAGVARPEIWAYGLRNPWRFSFDRATGDLWIADVGQNQWEEVDWEPADSVGGANYGWNVWEGNHRFRPGDVEDAVFPVAEIGHDEGDCSITGGHVYRGARVPALVGWYVFSDYCSGILRAVAPQGEAWRTITLLDTDHNVSGFGEDADGELYVVDHGGRVLRIAAAT